jgi:excisionase family DNA binding protein
MPDRPVRVKTMAGTLNLKEVAQRLGVHYMTAYRYVRLGRLPAEREGTGWRVREDDLVRFTSAEAESTTDDPGSVDWPGRLADRLLAGDEPGAWSVVEAALVAGFSPQDCYLDLVVGALARISDEGTAGGLDVADSYVATATAGRIVARLGGRFRRPGRTRGHRQSVV